MKPTFHFISGLPRAGSTLTAAILRLRRILNPMGTMHAIDFLLDKLRNTKSNSEFFESMNT